MNYRQPFLLLRRLDDRMLTPLPAAKWNYTAAAHLLNRAGFGGPPADIRRVFELGPDRAVSWLVDYEKVPDTTSNPDWAKPDPGRIERYAQLRDLNREMREAPAEKRPAIEEKRRQMQREERRTHQEHLLDLRAWWLRRMASGPRPLQEKLTLFWHGHFATSVQKVRDPYLMWLQNETFRRHASGRWLPLIEAISKDPAMLLWLDQAQSRKEHPNENFAREVMELFSLGEGHYTEKDVTEAARAFTGWSLDRVRQIFAYRRAQHDDGAKTVLGRSGNLGGGDVLAQIVAQPQASRFIVGKLWNFFASDNAPDGVVEALTQEFRKSGDSFQAVLRRMFRSGEFYADSVVRQQVKSPVQWLVNSTRLLERELPTPAVSNTVLRLLGQELFAPPNVKGWDGGLSWITTNNLLSRYNVAALLVTGENPTSLPRGRRNAKRSPRNVPAGQPLLRPVNIETLFNSEQRRDKTALLTAIEERLLQTRFREKQSAALREYLESQGPLDEDDILHVIRLAMSTPEFQLT